MAPKRCGGASASNLRSARPRPRQSCLLEFAGKASRGAGMAMAIDNRLLARTAKLAGAPKMPVAGMVFHAPLAMLVAVGQPLFTLCRFARRARVGAWLCTGAE